ncbi:Lar family restriction alleviation protein (plasmid) [Microbulbifer sp. TRSA001]|uniref:Lar family restriction alleviation protein n=1 Tax=Microbulbifer sp. TRSA001 TaxID=3243381 RepID=UPI0040393C24
MGEEIKLKGCPFCGAKAAFNIDSDGWQWIECIGCHVATNQRVSAMEDCRPLLAEEWNSRVSGAEAKGNG